MEIIKVLDKNTIEFQVGDVKKRIFFSFGMDKELVSIVGSFISNFYKIKADLDTSEAVASIEETLGDIDKVLKEVKLQPSLLYETLAKEMELSYDVIGKLGSLVLTERDDYGKVTNIVTASEIMYAKKYQTEEWTKFFKELFDYCLERFNNIVKERTSENPPEAEKEEDG